MISSRKVRMVDHLLSKMTKGLETHLTAYRMELPHDVQEAVNRAVRDDIKVNPAELASRFGISANVAEQLKDTELRIFAQADWFFETLLTYEGPGLLNPENEFSMNALMEAEKQNPESLHEGKLISAIRALVVKHKEVNPLPYTRTYQVVD
jgi:hypothetical protein